MIQVYLSNLHCDEETDEVGADEPYVFVTAVNLILQRTFDVVSFCLTSLASGGQNDPAYRHGACDGVDPTGH